MVFSETFSNSGSESKHGHGVLMLRLRYLIGASHKKLRQFRTRRLQFRLNFMDPRFVKTGMVGLRTLSALMYYPIGKAAPTRCLRNTRGIRDRRRIKSALFPDDPEIQLSISPAPPEVAA